MSLISNKSLAWERAIREGRSREVADELSKLKLGGLSPEERKWVASLSYRCGVPVLGIRLLQRQVRPRAIRRSSEPVDPPTIAAYALCLSRIGATEEASDLLMPLDPARFPKILFYRAVVNVSSWRYGEAIPLLEAYLKKAKGYEAMVAKVNLIAAYVFCRRDREAKALIRGVLHDTSLRKYRLLHANVLELAAQSCLEREEWKTAREYLAKASELLSSTKGVDAFFVLKWEKIVNYLSTGEKSHLKTLREEASRRQHWETLRDVDRFEALSSKTPELFWRVYFGTPHPAYRESILEQFRKKWKTPMEVPSSYERVFTRGKGASISVDLVAGKARTTKIPGLIHRTLVVLARDAYAPTRSATFFRKLFVDEYFDLSTSTHRVHEAIRRTRRWLAGEKIPLFIEEQGGTYRLCASAPVSLTLNESSTDAATPWLARIRKASNDSSFAVREIEELLAVSRRTLQRELDRLVFQGVLRRAGKGRGVRYEWASLAARSRLS